MVIAPHDSSGTRSRFATACVDQCTRSIEIAGAREEQCRRRGALDHQVLLMVVAEAGERVGGVLSAVLVERAAPPTHQPGEPAAPFEDAGVGGAAQFGERVERGLGAAGVAEQDRTVVVGHRGHRGIGAQRR